jgi:hypothetical protein
VFLGQGDGLERGRGAERGGGVVGRTHGELQDEGAGRWPGGSEHHKRRTRFGAVRRPGRIRRNRRRHRGRRRPVALPEPPDP